MVSTPITAAEKRNAVRNKYSEIIGRNKYSQSLRDYCYKKYKNGKYYSDCSSSISYAYKEAGFSFGILNTVGMYTSKKLIDVPVKIKSGIIQNPEVLRVGDMLLFAGNDNSRRANDCVGHVEMVDTITSSKITICGHGSGTPRRTEMNAYCRSRYNSKTNTVIGNRGLLKVRRYILDGETTITDPITGTKIIVKDGMSVHVRTGPSSDYKSLGVFKGGAEFAFINTEGWFPVKHNNMVLWVSDKYAKNTFSDNIEITGGTVNMRSGPGKDYPSVRLAKRHENYILVHPNGWHTIKYGGIACWIASRYTKKTM